MGSRTIDTLGNFMLRRRMLKATALLAGGASLPVPLLAAKVEPLAFRWMRIGRVPRLSHCQLDILHASTTPAAELDDYIESAQLSIQSGGGADRCIWSMQRYTRSYRILLSAVRLIHTPRLPLSAPSPP